jgi:hypothetical protein
MDNALKDLAIAEFRARERLRHLSMMNTPVDYEERLRIAVELVEAQVAAKIAKRLLDEAIFKASEGHLT